MILEKFIKQPSERKDYDVDFEPWLSSMTTVGGSAATDTLSDITGTPTCITDPTDASLLVTDIIFTPTRAKFWVSGGVAGNKYKITIQATTVGGRSDESELIFTVKDF